MSRAGPEGLGAGFCCAGGLEAAVFPSTSLVSVLTRDAGAEFLTTVFCAPAEGETGLRVAPGFAGTEGALEALEA